MAYLSFEEKINLKILHYTETAKLLEIKSKRSDLSKLPSSFEGQKQESKEEPKEKNRTKNNQTKLLKTNDLVEMFGVSRTTIHNWKLSGKLPFYRIGGKIYFKEEEVINSMKGVKIHSKRF